MRWYTQIPLMRIGGLNVPTVSVFVDKKMLLIINKKDMETIEIKDINGVVLFVHTAENNSIEITVEEAVKKNVNLFGANLTNAKLKGANFEGADLEGANLVGANFEGANMKGANLKSANLRYATLEGVNLEGANLKGAFLYWADLERANLKGAHLRYATLEGANLKGTNLRVANLYWADLEGASLEGASLEGAYFMHADLKSTNFCRANLAGANFEGANFEGSNLEGANLKRTYFFDTNLKGARFKDNNFEEASFHRTQDIPYIPLACPSEGAFIGWKKVEEKYLVKIQIPEDARRLSATTRKCRCDKAVVLDITSLDGETHFDEVTNYNYNETIYKVGEIVYPDSFDENRWNECSHGIHFFVDKKDAIEY